MKPHEIEFELHGLYHAAYYTLNPNGTLHIDELLRDNRDGGCEPCELTPEINYYLHQLLSDETEARREAFNYQKLPKSQRVELGY